MHVTVRLNGSLRRRLRVERGVRQGYITSPWMFNLVYQELVQRVNELNCGISIGYKRVNIFCYADDLHLASTTITGLQCMIDACTDYVQAHGLNINASKTSWSINGKPPFTTEPTLVLLLLLSCPSHDVLPLASACLCPLCHCGQVVSRTRLV